MKALDSLPTRLRRAIKRHHVPGASMAVLKGNRIVATTSAGVTSWASVTARHFLSHQSGIDGDFFVDSGRGDDCIERFVDMATMVPSLFPIGTKLSYCNLGFAVLGRVIEVLTRKSWDAALQERIFDPLGMEHAFSRPEDALRFRCAIGHVQSRRDKDVWHASRIPYLSFGQKAAGATPSMTASDLLRFAQMHLNGGRNRRGDKILYARSVKAMQRRQLRAPAYTPHSIIGWGLGWTLMDWQGHKVFGHDGGTIGQASFLRILPDKNIAVALLTNGGDTYGIYREMFDHVFDTIAKVTIPDEPTGTEHPEPDIDALTGAYANLNQTIEIEPTEDGIVARLIPNGADASTNEHKLSFIDQHVARFDSGDEILDRTRLIFSDVEQGQMQYVAMGLRQYRRIGQRSSG